MFGFNLNTFKSPLQNKNMSKEDKFEEKLGTFKTKTHLLTWVLYRNIDEFVINVSFPKFPQRVQIVRIDNRGKPLHMDRLWKENDIKKPLNWSGNVWENFSKAYNLLEKNWKEYARKYDNKKGY